MGEAEEVVRDLFAAMSRGPTICRRNGASGLEPADAAAPRAADRRFHRRHDRPLRHGRARAAVRRDAGVAVAATGGRQEFSSPPRFRFAIRRRMNVFHAVHRSTSVAAVETLAQIRRPGRAARSLAHRGRAAARRRPRRSRHQRRDGAGQDAGLKPRDLAEKIAAELAKLRRSTGPRSPGRASSTSRSSRRSGARRWPMRSAKARPTAAATSAPASGQRRICLGQPDRADACRPLPRRGVRRCAGQSAGVRRLRGDARVLHQRCRRAGRCAGALGVPALPRGAGRDDRRDPGGALSRATT